jgi:hypothetical protein
VLFRFPLLHIDRPDRGELLRAFVENIAYAIRGNVDQIAALTGTPAREILVSGGLTQSPTVLRVLAATLDDLQEMRIMAGNRISAAERRYGDALPHLHEALQPLLDAEHRAELMLKQVWRRHPLAPWAKGVPGCGEKLIARLVALTGEPSLRAVGHWANGAGSGRVWVVDGYEERSAGELLAYCGHGEPARSPRRGMTQAELFKAGNPDAKKAAWKLGYQFMRTPRSPYRERYLRERERYAAKVHDRSCPRCGPAGHPALPGSPWSENHKHHAAIRNTTHAFLVDLWRESRRLRGLTTTAKRGGAARRR